MYPGGLAFHTAGVAAASAALHLHARRPYQEVGRGGINLTPRYLIYHRPCFADSRDGLLNASFSANGHRTVLLHMFSRMNTIRPQVCLWNIIISYGVNLQEALQVADAVDLAVRQPLDQLLRDLGLLAGGKGQVAKTYQQNASPGPHRGLVHFRYGGKATLMERSCRPAPAAQKFSTIPQGKGSGVASGVLRIQGGSGLPRGGGAGITALPLFVRSSPTGARPLSFLPLSLAPLGS